MHAPRLCFALNSHSYLKRFAAKSFSLGRHEAAGAVLSEPRAVESRSLVVTGQIGRTQGNRKSKKKKLSLKHPGPDLVACAPPNSLTQVQHSEAHSRAQEAGQEGGQKAGAQEAREKGSRQPGRLAALMQAMDLKFGSQPRDSQQPAMEGAVSLCPWRVGISWASRVRLVGFDWVTHLDILDAGWRASCWRTSKRRKQSGRKH